MLLVSAQSIVVTHHSYTLTAGQAHLLPRPEPLRHIFPCALPHIQRARARRKALASAPTGRPLRRTGEDGSSVVGAAQARRRHGRRGGAGRLPAGIEMHTACWAGAPWSLPMHYARTRHVSYIARALVTAAQRPHLLPHRAHHCTTTSVLSRLLLLAGAVCTKWLESRDDESRLGSGSGR